MSHEALAAAERDHDPEGLIVAHSTVIGLLASSGDVASARSRLDAAERIADGLRLPIVRWHILFLRAGLAALTGDLDHAERDTMTSIEVGRAANVSESRIMAVAGALLLLTRDGQGRIGELVPTMEELVRTQPGAPAWRVGLAGALMRCGRLEEARVHFDWLSADDCARVPGDAYFPVTLCGLGQGCLALGADEAVAASIYDHLLPHAGTFNYTPAITDPNDLGLAGAAWAAGEVEVADRHFVASAELCERAGARPYLARTHLDWARTLASRGRTVDAKEHAEAVRAIAEEIGMLGPDGPMPLVRTLLDC